MRARPIAIAILLLAAVPPAHARERTTIAKLRGAQRIATYGGVTAVSIRAGTRYALAVVERDGTVRRLEAPTRTEPFDADAGPDTRGRPVVVYSRDGDLVIDRLRGAGPEPIRTASTTTADESEPSVWRGRIAWETDDGVLTRNRLLARTTPSRRVPGVPRHADVVQVEVHRRLIATSAYQGRPDPDIQPQHVRLFDLASGRSRRVWVNRAGIAGQRIVGLSFARGWLGFHRSCFGDPGGCLDGGARRHRVADGRYEWTTAYRTLYGFALTRRGTVELTEDGRLQRLAPPAWRPLPRNLRRRYAS
ncbi:MAG TPA: hypothetical protein VHF89_01150 [Solirubrobacteraceae bacterium]|nr:hypothetical protein [Solirubrobacteraceae bacterium]